MILFYLTIALSCITIILNPSSSPISLLFPLAHRLPPLTPPAEIGSFIHPVESEMLCSLVTPTKIPYFNAPIYLENKTQIGKVDEILGPINEVYFTVKMDSGMVATSFKKEDKVYISGEKLLPIERFLPKPKTAGGKGECTQSVFFRELELEPEDSNWPLTVFLCSCCSAPFTLFVYSSPFLSTFLLPASARSLAPTIHTALLANVLPTPQQSRVSNISRPPHPTLPQNPTNHSPSPPFPSPSYPKSNSY